MQIRSGNDLEHSVNESCGVLIEPLRVVDVIRSRHIPSARGALVLERIERVAQQEPVKHIESGVKSGWLNGATQSKCIQTRADVRVGMIKSHVNGCANGCRGEGQGT